MRVVRVLGSLDVGGAELRLVELIPGLVASGVEPHVVTVSGRAGELASRAEELGAVMHPLRLDAGFPPRFVRLLRRIRPRAVHSEIATASGVILALAAVAGVPVRIAQFDSDGDGRASTPRRIAQRAALKTMIGAFATHIVGVSPGALRNGFRASWKVDPRCRVVPNGFDPARLSLPSGFLLRQTIGASGDEPLCLHVGRPHPAKRRWLIPPIVAALLAEGAPARAALIGPRSEEDDDRVLAEAERFGVADRVSLLGPRADIGCLLRQADVLLLPSEREGLPGALLEAAALGTPAVASDLPGVRYLARHFRGITRVDPDADAPTWARAVRHARDRHPIATRDPERALAAFQTTAFSLQTAVRRNLALYAEADRAPGR